MAHSLFGPSSAERWMGCPASVQATKDMPNTTSSYALEGTTAHALAEMLLGENMNIEDIPNTKAMDVYPSDMREFVQEYVDRVRIEMVDCDFCAFEQRVDFSEYVPDGFGTSDVIIIKGDTIKVIDLKYGKGIQVDAEHNKQGMLYALGAYLDYSIIFDIKKAEIIIDQPRLDHVSKWELSVDDLIKFARQAMEAAEEAIQDNPRFGPSEKACQWCKIKLECKARAKANIMNMIDELEGITPDSAVLNMDQIAKMLPAMKEVADWAKGIRELALKKAMSGEKVKGYKVVRGISRRKWTADAEEKLKKHKKLFETKLVGVASAERILGKEKGELEGLVIKPEGAPTLVLQSDKREEINRNETARNEFN